MAAEIHLGSLYGWLQWKNLNMAFGVEKPFCVFPSQKRFSRVEDFLRRLDFFFFFFNLGGEYGKKKDLWLGEGRGAGQFSQHVMCH